MLVSFSFGNYKSFKEENRISLVADMPDEGHIYTLPTPFGYSLLKTIAVYGPNASGKSKLFEAFAFMRGVVCPPAATPNIPGFNFWKNQYSPFRLSTQTADSPSFFEAVFIIDNIQYRYGIELTPDGISQEWLYRKSQRESLILSREVQENGSLKMKIVSAYINSRIYDNIKNAGMVSPEAPILTLLSTFNDPLCRQIMEEFRHTTVISANDMGAPIEALINGEEKREILDFMRAFDFNIEDFSPHEISPEEIPDKIRSMIGEESLKGKFYDGVSTTHRLYDSDYNKVGTRQFLLEKDESFGTNRLLRLSWPVLKALKNGHTLFVDELDSGFHNYIVSAIVSLFYKTDTQAQLIFNTQNTGLLSYTMDYDKARDGKKELLRKDQVYVVNKNRYGESNVYPITQFSNSIRASLEKLYLNGSFTGVPYVELDNILDLINREP